MPKRKIRWVSVVNRTRKTRRLVEWTRKPTSAQLTKLEHEPGVKTLDTFLVRA